MLMVCYTNWKGNTSIRKVRPETVWKGTTEWHPKVQWFLKALDVEKGEMRNFAMNDIHWMKSCSD